MEQDPEVTLEDQEMEEEMVKEEQVVKGLVGRLVVKEETVKN
jgi:hypothetical protein